MKRLQLFVLQKFSVMEVNKVELPNDVMLGEVSKMLDEGHNVTFMAKGNSMLPFIVGEKDSVEIGKRPEYKPGDIVLSKTDRKIWVLHRYLSSDGETVTLKGDGNLVGTEKCAVGDIVGAVDRIIKPGRVVDCSSAVFKKESAAWRRQPYLIRRVILAIYRRVI